MNVTDATGLTFFAKKPLRCPVCGAKVFREEMRTGRGRQIAGNLTQELRRNYEPSKQYGEVYPLIYVVTVCPTCLYAALPEDFSVERDDVIERLKSENDERVALVSGIFPDLDFTSPRGLEEGVASYMLATKCYDAFPSSFSPRFKGGLCQLRSAWLAGDLHRKASDENYDYLAGVFYRKARFFYTHAVEGEQDGSEPLSGAKSLGPDLDKNYGYDGFLYIAGLLEYRYGPRSDPQARIEALTRAKRAVARIFGMGKASKNKPAAILDNARDVYDAIADELKEHEPSP